MGKNVQVQVYVTEVESHVWKGEAAARGISLAEFVRQCVTRALSTHDPQHEDAAHEAAKADLIRKIGRAEGQLASLQEKLKETTSIQKTAEEGEITYGHAATRLRGETPDGRRTKEQTNLLVTWDAMVGRAASVADSAGKREFVLQGKIRSLENDLFELYTEGMGYGIPPHPRYTVVTDPPIVPFVDASSAVIAPPAWQRAAKGE